jgi:hypothetical protein
MRHVLFALSEVPWSDFTMLLLIIYMTYGFKWLVS